MNRDEKAAVIEQTAREIDEAQAIFAVDYRGISVKQSAELRSRLDGADASFRVVKNRLSLRAADQAGAESLKTLLEGPTALTFVRGDAALAAKELAAFRREHGLLVFKGGTMDGDALSPEDVESISRLPAREVLYGQLVGVTASPLTGLVRGLSGLISGLGRQLQQMADQGLVGGGANGAPAAGDDPEPASTGGDVPSPEGDAAGAANEGGGDASDAVDTGTSVSDAEAPGDPVSEAAAAEEEAAGGDESAAETPTDQPE